MEQNKMKLLSASLRDVEAALAAVEKNGVHQIVTHEGSSPCGGCYTYQRAVRKALSLLRSLNLEEVAEGEIV